MYKLIIIDDEKIIVEGVKFLIEMMELDLEIVYASTNGLEAIEYVTNNPVDIIISDISMPKINGLDLIKTCKRINEKLKFIIISGYSDFNYAKEAIALGIENYILKPINEDELEETLKLTVNSIRKQNEENYLIQNNKKVIKNNLCMRWINNSIKEDELIEKEFILDIDLKYKYYYTFLFKYNKSVKEDEIINFFNEKVSDNSMQIFQDIRGEIIVIKGINSYKDIVEIKEEIELFFRGFQVHKEKNLYKNNKISLSYKFYKLDIGDYYISVGKLVDSYTKVYESYRISKDISKRLLTYGYNNDIIYEDIPIELHLEEDIKEFLNGFYQRLISKDESKSMEIIFNLCRFIRENKKVEVKFCYAVFIDIVGVIKKVSKELNFYNHYTLKNYNEIIKDINNCDTLFDIYNIILDNVKGLITLINKNEVSFSPVIHQILSNVEKNYNKEISLKTLSNEYNINTTYLGQVFIKEFGISFSEYLNKLRSDKAKNLILNSNLKINEISYMVGYSDTSYFYKKFKKIYGISPKELRKLKNY